jgi:hypothetical protein
VLLLFAGALLAAATRPAWGTWTLAVFLIADPFSVSTRFVRTTPDGRYSAITAETPAVRALREAKAAGQVFRIYQNTRSGNNTVNRWLLHEIESANAYFAASLSWYDDLWGSGIPGQRLLSLFNVRYVVVDDERTGGERAVEIPLDLPRFFTADRFTVLSNREERLARLRATDFDPRQEILLEHDPGIVSPPRAANADVVTVVDRSDPDRIRLRATTQQPTLLFLSEIWFPRWVAEVNGQPVPVLRADHAFRAIPLPAGECDVVCRYDGDGLFVKMWLLSLLSILAVLAAAIGHVVVERRRSESVPVSRSPSHVL